jgi:hypothetical protein
VRLSPIDVIGGNTDVSMYGTVSGLGVGEVGAVYMGVPELLPEGSVELLAVLGVLPISFSFDRMADI